MQALCYTKKQAALTGKIENQSVNRFVEQPAAMNYRITKLLVIY